MRGTVSSMETSNNENDNKKYLTSSDIEPLVNSELEWKLMV
jgi:hypothetical protein